MLSAPETIGSTAWAAKQAGNAILPTSRHSPCDQTKQVKCRNETTLMYELHL